MAPFILLSTVALVFYGGLHPGKMVLVFHMRTMAGVSVDLLLTVEYIIATVASIASILLAT